MKILYHHRIRSKDGQYVHVEELTNALKAMGHEIVMVAPAAMEEEEFGGESRLLGVLKRYLPGFLYELAEFAYSLLAYRRLTQAIRRHRPDIIYERYNIFLPAGIWAKRRFGLPLLLEVNAPLYHERKRYDGLKLDALARWTERYTWRGADRVLPVTDKLAEYIIAAGVPAQRITVIPNGVDLDDFAVGKQVAEAKAALRPTLRLERQTVLGFVGFVREWHGLERVVELLAEDGARSRHLLIVGDGPARPTIEARARELGVLEQVTITGVVARDQVMKYIEAFDIALQPSVVEYASPLKLFEYMALGRAIVAPDSPNIREILQDGHDAVLFDHNTPTAFKAAITHLLADPVRCGHIGVAARETLLERGLTWQRNARRVTDIAQSLLPQQQAMEQERPDA
jgi:glycosyltransferase involved in cell wall biosynthesis